MYEERRSRSWGHVAFRVIAGALLALLVGAAWVRHVEVPAQAQFNDPLEHFKYGSIGTEAEEGLPYWLWQVMPRVCPDKLPGPGGYASFGFHWEPGRELPIGFPKKNERIGVNCAFCHTTRVRTAPDAAPLLVHAGPGNVTNPQAYARFLQDCTADSRWNASNVMAEIGKLTSLSWGESFLYRFVYVGAARRALARQRDTFAWMYKRPDYGPGRVDPFNPPKFSFLSQPMDDTIGTADIPPIWNMKLRRNMRLHWDGMNPSFREVAVSSAIGDGASRKAVDTAGLKRVEDWVMELPPPKYPLPIDEKLASAGRTVYDATCASCHAVGQSRVGTVVPVEEVGTDRHRLDMWTTGAADAFNAYGAGYDWRLSQFRKTNGYVAMPHDALWIRAPYLHNGSVPTLTDLLEPPERRPKVFYRGFDLYDPQKVGFVSSGADAERYGFKYDTSLPGNGNGGHLFGTTLSADDKRALIEFLKTQ
jgi:hypothetical protein